MVAILVPVSAMQEVQAASQVEFREPWVLLDTETSGLKSPIYALEIGAQRMAGWEKNGPAFRCYLDHRQPIDPGASAINGLTRERLMRDGLPPVDAHKRLAEYVGDLPLVSFNLGYDLDEVLLPEWKRLGIEPIGRRGFCLWQLARRLLDPSPAGSCGLQALRRFYGLGGGDAHTALGDVQTSFELFGQVLRPLLQERGLLSWSEIAAFSETEWFPRVIRSGDFKGRFYGDAVFEPALHDWICTLASSDDVETAQRGKWYLRQIAQSKSKVFQ